MINYEGFIQEFIHHARNYQISLSDIVLQKCGTYFFLLREAQETVNLTAFRDVEEYVVYHLMDTLVLHKVLPGEKKELITDVGTGPGVPGILLAILRENSSINLVESISKKTAFLNRTIDKLQLNNCKVLSGRAEAFAQQDEYRETSDVVTARALSSLSQSLELTAGFVKVGGYIYLPRGTRDIADSDSDPIRLLGLERKEDIQYQLPGRSSAFQLLVYQKNQATSEKYPRKSVQIKKRPL